MGLKWWFWGGIAVPDMVRAGTGGSPLQMAGKRVDQSRASRYEAEKGFRGDVTSPDKVRTGAGGSPLQGEGSRVG